MKRILSLVMALVLVFSLAACGNNNETKKETVAETTVETITETTSEGIEGDGLEPGEDADSERAKQTQDETGEKVYTALVVKDNVVIANFEGGEQGVYTFEANDNTTLHQGHKYTFTIDPSLINNGAISVEKSEMLGKSIPYPLDEKIVEELKSKVEGIKVVDTRKVDDFESNHAEGALNVPAEEYFGLLAAKDADGVNAYKEKYLSTFTNDDVVIVYGSESDIIEMGTLIYKTGKTPVVLNGGEVK